MSLGGKRAGKAESRRELWGLLGDLPARKGPVRVDRRGEVAGRGYVLEKLVLHLNGLEPVPAFFTRPTGVKGRLACVLYNHYHGGEYGSGKTELVEERRLMHKPPYAEFLAGTGVSALAIDHWAFGERSARTEADIFKQMLWEGRVMWGMMVFDSVRALDYLAERDDVDAGRIGTLGLSMGSTMAWWVAALDERVKVCVDICCLTDFHALIEANGLAEHGIYYYVPRLLKSFSTGRINSLIAPRPHLALSGDRDPLTPAAGLDRVDRELREAYAREGAPEAWRLVRQDTDHRETPEMRAEITAWLRRWL